ncbi:MAG: hypothetical protein NTZ44_02265 [Candidatus Nomurabacteria bacterium]|nr:hypothetical protein [Candidatus Nomurabacteria bacterium]
MNENNIITPYESFPKVSKDFIDEVFARTNLCLEAINLISSYQKRFPKNKVELNEFKIIKYISRYFIIVEFCSLFDGGSNLSINLQKQKNNFNIKVQKLKLKKLFPSLTTKQFNILHKRLESLVKQHKDLLFKLMWTRHNKVAHANVSFYEDSDEEMKYDKKIILNLKTFIEEFQFFFSEIGFNDNFL